MTIGNKFYPLTITNTSFTDSPTIDFPYPVSNILIMHESRTDEIQYSYNGRDVEGIIQWDDESLNITDTGLGKIWLKTNNPSGSKLRVFIRA